MALPETIERLSHGEPTWFVRDKKTFVMYANNHHHDGRIAFWCAAAPGAQDILVHAQPDRIFVPPYVGYRGWLGVRLDLRRPDWGLIAQLVDDAYRAVAPQRLIDQIGEPRA